MASTASEFEFPAESFDEKLAALVAPFGACNILRAMFVLGELRNVEAKEAGSEVETASIFGESVEAGRVCGGFM